MGRQTPGFPMPAATGRAMAKGEAARGAAKRERAGGAKKIPARARAPARAVENPRTGSLSLAPEDEREEGLGPGEMASPRSALAKLLMLDGRVELTVRMAEAAKAVNLEQIQVFTQKGLYTRRIMDEMGLPDLQREINELRMRASRPERRLSRELTTATGTVAGTGARLRRAAVSAACGRYRAAAARGTPAQGEAQQRRTPQFSVDPGSRLQDGEETGGLAFTAQESIQTGPVEPAAHAAAEHGL